MRLVLALVGSLILSTSVFAQEERLAQLEKQVASQAKELAALKNPPETAAEVTQRVQQSYRDIFNRLVSQAGPACKAHKGSLSIDIDPQTGNITKITCAGMKP